MYLRLYTVTTKIKQQAKHLTPQSVKTSSAYRYFNNSNAYFSTYNNAATLH